MARVVKASRSRNYHFQASWEEEYFVTAFGDACTCLICGYVFSTNKKYNVQRHFERYHVKHNMIFPRMSPARRSEITNLKSKLPTTTPSPESMHLLKSGSQATTLLSFKLAYFLAKSMKPLDDGAFIKQSTITTVKELLQDSDFKDSFVAKIDEVPLSRRTLTRRVKDISDNISAQLMEDLQKCKVLSVQIAESTDVSDPAQLCIFVRMVFDDCTVAEDFLSMIPLKSRTTSRDIFTALKTNLKEKSVPLGKIVSMTTDGTPAMIDASGLVELWRNDPDFPTIPNFRCIIHQLALCANLLDMNHVLEPITKIVNSIRAGSLQHKLFQSLIDEVNPKDLLLHTEMRWLNKGRVLNRFYEVLPEIKKFVESRGKEYGEIEGKAWLQDFTFFTDLMGFMSEVNSQVQEKNIPIWKLVGYVNCFHEKVVLWTEYFQANKIPCVFVKFTKTTQELQVKDDFDGKRFAEYMRQLDEEFQKRFEDFSSVKLVARYFHDPFSSDDFAKVTSAMVKIFPDVNDLLTRTEIIEFRHNDTNRTNLRRLNDESEIPYFWQNVDHQKYENLLRVFVRLLSTFGSSYLCEKMFFSMKHVKSKLRSRLTDENLDSLLRISASDYEPDFRRFTREGQSQKSH